jgi:dTDP-4-dehydrorhamnose 3,5-epimerase
VYDYKELPLEFNHDKVAISRQNVLRGLHGDGKAFKLITCLHGEIYLVVVDNREWSPTYLKWDSIILTGNNKKSILVPPGFGNGHLVLSESATFFYKVDKFYEPGNEVGIMYNDKDLNIDWRLPTSELIFSEKDKTLGSFAEYAASL